MSDINTANEQLMNLIFTALDHGIDSIKDSGGPLIPFMMTETNGEKKLERFVTEKLEDGPVMAKKQLKDLTPPPDFAAIAYDGYVTIENKKYDAVMVEGFDQNESEGFILAQRYKPKKLLSSFKTIGNAAYIGNTKQLINTDGKKPVDTNKLSYYFTIMFKDNGSDLGTLSNKLKMSNLNVNQKGDELEVFWEDGPKMYVKFFCGEDLVSEHAYLSKGTEFENEMNEANARYQVAFADINEVVDEMNTLFEVQGALQELTNGIIFRSWNQQLSRE